MVQLPTFLDRLYKGVTEVAHFAQHLSVTTPPDHGVVLVQVVLEGVPRQGYAPSGPQAVYCGKPLGGRVLDLVALVGHHNLCFFTHDVEGSLGHQHLHISKQPMLHYTSTTFVEEC